MVDVEVPKPSRWTPSGGYLSVDTDRDCWAGYSGRAVRTLLDDLDAFYLKHRCCGRLDPDVENGRVWMTCECGAAIAEPIGTGVMSPTLPIATP